MYTAGFFLGVIITCAALSRWLRLFVVATAKSTHASLANLAAAATNTNTTIISANDKGYGSRCNSGVGVREERQSLLATNTHHNSHTNIHTLTNHTNNTQPGYQYYTDINTSNGIYTPHTGTAPVHTGSGHHSGPEPNNNNNNRAESVNSYNSDASTVISHPVGSGKKQPIYNFN